MKVIVKPFFLLCIAFFSNTSGATDLMNISDFPDWFTEGLARETNIKKSSTLKIKELEVNSKVLGKYTLAEKSDNFWYYTIDINTASPAECYVFTDYDGPASSLHSILEHSLTSVETLNDKKLSSKSTFSLNTGIVKDSPYLSLDIMYLLGEGEQRTTGILKGLVSESNDVLRMCIHNEIGYRESFFKVFESFVDAMNSQTPTSFFEATYALLVNNIPMGYMQEIYSVDADGDIETKNRTSLLVPVDASSISRNDTSGLSWSKPDGSLINATEYTIENGNMSSQFSLQYADDAWQVEGQLQGKTITKTLEHDGWFLSGFGSYLALAELKGGDDTSANYHMWAPTADPTSALPVTLRQLNDNPEANFEVDMGPIVMQFLANKDNVFQKGTIQQGPITMKMSLLHSKGQPTLP